jgi:hypothetical protein
MCALTFAQGAIPAEMPGQRTILRRYGRLLIVRREETFRQSGRVRAI